MSFAFLLQYETAARARRKPKILREMSQQTEQAFENLMDDAIVWVFFYQMMSIFNLLVFIMWQFIKILFNIST